MKVVLLIISSLCLFTTNALASDLPPTSDATTRYDAVSVMSIISATANVTYNPPSTTSMAFYEGSVDVVVKVEGNICGADPTSIGLFKTAEGTKTTIHLMVGKRNAADREFCLHYSKPAEVKFKLTVYEYESPGQTVDQSLGILNYFDGMSGNQGRIDLRIKGQNGSLKLDLVEL